MALEWERGRVEGGGGGGVGDAFCVHFRCCVLLVVVDAGESSGIAAMR